MTFEQGLKLMDQQIEEQRALVPAVHAIPACPLVRGCDSGKVLLERAHEEILRITSNSRVAWGA